MISLYYINENSHKVNYKLLDWEAVYNLANMLSKSPIDIEFLNYEDGMSVGLFNLNTFEKC